MQIKGIIIETPPTSRDMLEIVGRVAITWHIFLDADSSVEVCL
jgi:hypothetical protein